MNQLSLFEREETPLFFPPEPHDSIMGRACTLDGKPARVKYGGPVLAQIEPVDLEQPEIFLPWNLVEDRLEDGAAFQSREADRE